MIVAVGLSTEVLNAAIASFPTATLTLGWEGVPELDLQGYRVLVGTESGQYTQTYDVGLATTFEVPNLQIGQTYYFAVIAIDNRGLESPPSAELMVTIAPPPLPDKPTLSSNTDGSLSLQWTFPNSAMSSAPEFIIEESSDLVSWTRVATVRDTDAAHGDAELTHFSWSVPTTGERMFYRLTAENWMGTSTAP
jgi:Fibronectin type III domain